MYNHQQTLLQFWEVLFLHAPVIPFTCFTLVSLSFLILILQLFLSPPSLSLLPLPILVSLNAIGVIVPTLSDEIQMIIFLFGSQVVSIVFGNAFPLFMQLRNRHGTIRIGIAKFLIEQFGLTRSLSLLAEILFRDEGMDTPLWINIINIMITMSAMISLTVLRKQTTGRLFFFIQSISFIHAVGFQLFDNQILSRFLELNPRFGYSGEQFLMVIYRLVVQCLLLLLTLSLSFIRKPLQQEKRKESILITNEP